ncbi:Beta-lactamase class C [Minicystis rosea]|nr:Beta-lactamase class C [Minicystis rosea]
MCRLTRGACCAAVGVISFVTGCAAPRAEVPASSGASRAAVVEAPPIAKPPPFERITAAEAGVDAAALEVLRRRGAETRSDAVIVLRDGKLVLDERYGHEDGPIETMSVSKSLVALVVGRLVDTGRIRSIDEPVHRFYPEWKQGKKEHVTVRHLLEQTSGLQANRTTEEIYASPDFVHLALSAELTTDPGTTFFYNNKAVNLLAGIAQIAGKKPLDLLAREELFGPLGIDEVGWDHDKAGNPHAMSGIQLRPLDLAKVGQMMLDGGRYQGRQIVSADWIRRTTTPSAKNDRYGFLTWIEHDASFVLDDSVFDAWKKAGLEPAFIAKILPLKDRVFAPNDDFFGAIAAAIGGEKKVALESWYDHTWRRGLPDARAIDKHQIGFRMDGYLGQVVVVFPEKHLVAVRMRRFREGEGDQREYQFGDFVKKVRALVH